MKIQFLVGAALAPLMLASAPAFAQDATGEQDDDSADIVVTGTRASLERALDLKRENVEFTDSIVTEDILDFPDLNIGEALQRIPGVTLDRNGSGEGQSISLRGLPANFVRTTLNGITAAPTSGGGALSRNFDFDVFASELFSSVTIYKSPSAEYAEGGIAGSVDLRTPRPFDFRRPTFAASLSGQISELGGVDGNGFDDIGPRVSVLGAWQNDAGTFGVAVSAAYQDYTYRSDISQSFQFLNSARILNRTLSGIDNGSINPANITLNGSAATRAALADVAANAVYPRLPRVGPEIVERERLGLTGSIQLKPSDKLELTLDVLYATLNDSGLRPTIDGFFEITERTTLLPVNLTVENDVIIAGTFNNVSQRTETAVETFNSNFLHVTFGAEFEATDRLSLSTLIGYSQVEEDELRRTYLFENRGLFSFDLSQDVEFVQFGGPNLDYLDPNDFVPNQLRFRPADKQGDEFSAQIDAAFELDGGLSAIKAGFRYSETNAEQTRGEIRPSFNAAFSEVARPLGLSNFLANGLPGTLTNYLITDPALGESLLLPDGQNVPTDFNGTFAINERILSGYGQADFDFELAGLPIDGNIGVRLVETNQTSDGFLIVGGLPEAVSVNNTYTDVLPSVNLRAELFDDFFLRFAANKAMARPTFGEITPGLTIQATNLVASGGNPELDPFRANQFDAGVEWYFSEEGLLSATFYYKDIESFISSVTRPEVINGTNLVNDNGENVSGRTFQVTRPVNGEDGYLYGVEFSFQQPFTFLPAPLDGFGIQANLTLSDSEGTVLGERQALQGQSDLTYNIIGYYEKGPFALRAAWSYRDEFLVGADQGEPFFTASRGQLDISASLAVTDNITLTADVLNANSENDLLFYDRQGQILNRTFREQGRVVVIGARARF